jgi:hypothetical protein
MDIIWIIGGGVIGLGLLLKLIGEKTGIDFNDKRYFKAPEMTSTVALDSNNPIGDEV